MLSFFNSKKIIDDKLLEQIEEDLIKADVGMKSTLFVMNKLKKNNINQEVSLDELRNLVFNILKEDLQPLFLKDKIVIDKKPFVITMVGTNGSGKTTSIGKLAKMLKENGYRVLLAPCDTFRSGAKEQLRIWANKINVDFFEDNAQDPAAVAYKSLEFANSNNYDVLIIDTAGRQENNINLMNELEKIDKSLKKIFPSTPHETIFVVDATIGQNAILQAKSFNKYVNITGIILTKMDSQAKGGILIDIVRNLFAPIYFMGIGEGEDDYIKFNLDEYLLTLVNKEKPQAPVKITRDEEFNKLQQALNEEIQLKQNSLSNILSKHSKEVEDIVSQNYSDEELEDFLKNLNMEEVNSYVNNTNSGKIDDSVSINDINKNVHMEANETSTTQNMENNKIDNKKKLFGFLKK